MWDPFWTFGPVTGFGGSNQANEATTRAAAAEQRVRELEHRVERLALACSAMWDLLRARQGMTDQQLREKIEQLDAADGITDGRDHKMVQCTTCGRQVAARRGKCIYCGTAVVGTSVFSGE